MKELLKFLKNPWRWYKDRKAFEKRMADLRKRDPFIYK